MRISRKKRLHCLPGWPTLCTRYEYRPGDDFLRGSRDVMATMFPGVLLGAPGVNIDPATTFSEGVKLCSLLRPPGWPTR
ncbi:unnamed protein product, partial [Trichogramma brassicae]